MTDLDARIRRGVVEYADAAPVPDPPKFGRADHRERVRPGLRRRWLAPVAAAVGVGVVLLTVTVPIPLGNPGARDSAAGPATLPTAFADYSALTGSVTDAPPGRSIAAFVLENEVVYRPNQVIVLAADADRYRYVEEAETYSVFLHHERSPVLLSGDGTRVAVGSGSRAVSDITAVDLRTGEVARFPVDADSTVTLLAWSPDGRWLAYGIRPFQAMPPFYGESLRARGGRLMVLDVTSGQAHPITGPAIPESVAQAAFSPDGSLLAVQAGGPGESEHQPAPPGSEVRMVRGGSEWAHPSVIDTVAVPPFYELAGQSAFSPDGSRLALTAVSGRPESGAWLHTVERSDEGWVAGPGPASGMRDDYFLGWQSSERIVVRSGQEILGVDIGGGSRQLLSRISASTQGVVYNVQLAYTLLPGLEVRAVGEVDRGPWPPWLRAAVTGVVLILLAAATVAVLVRRAHRRRSPSLRIPTRRDGHPEPPPHLS